MTPAEISKPLSEPEALISEREKTHGNYEDNSIAYIELVTLMSKIRAANGQTKLDPRQQFAQHMICVKLARILSGNANVAEHWRDIAGYATLAVKSCSE